MSRDDSMNRITQASRACEKALAEWRRAIKELDSSVSVNGYGIFHDPVHIRSKLSSARLAIEEAERILSAVQFPTSADYDNA